MRRISTAAWTWAFGLYAYAATVTSAAWFARRAARGHGAVLGVWDSLVWQGAGYAAWAPAAGLVWLVLRRFGAGGRGLAALTVLMLAAAPLEALTGAAIDMAFVGSVGGLPELAGRAVGRLPVAILLFTAIAAVGVAAVHHRRAGEARAENRALQDSLAAARAALEADRPAGPLEPERLMVSVGSRRAPVPLAEVEWLASAGNYVVVHWSVLGNAREGLVRETLQGLEARLDPAVFARSHRSALVNLALVNLARVREAQSLSDGSWRLTLESGAELVASRTYRDALLKRLGR